MVFVTTASFIPGTDEDPKPLGTEPEKAETNIENRFDDHVTSLFTDCELEGKLTFEVFRLALIGYYNMKSQELLPKDSLITIIDFDQPSDQKRMFVINLNTRSVQVNTLVAHGKNTGEVKALRFSNRAKSNQSSLGFYYTNETYDGKHKYSLKIDGVDTLYNHNARSRGVVFHGADYVSEEYLVSNGRLGRSFGCPALPRKTNQAIVDLIKDGSMVFIYASNEGYLKSSKYLNLEKALEFFKLELVQS